jgi:hypothetical protein
MLLAKAVGWAAAWRRSPARAARLGRLGPACAATKLRHELHDLRIIPSGVHQARRARPTLRVTCNGGRPLVLENMEAPRSPQRDT